MLRAIRMQAGDAAHDRFLLAICPQCQEPLYPRREHAGKQVRCPECGAVVPVPHEEPPPEPEGNEYGVGGDDYVARRTTYIKLPCPTCSTLLYAEPSRVGTTMTCPDCGVEVLVRQTEQPQERKRSAEEIGDYRVGGFEQPASDKHDHFLMVCPTCNARLHPSRKLSGKRVKCPDCGEKIVVPAAPEKKAEAAIAAVEEYALETAASERLKLEDYIAFACPQCGTRLTGKRQDMGKTIRCPDCRREAVIPKKSARASQRLPEIAEDRLAADDFVPPPELQAPVEPDSIAHRVPNAKAPTWTFFSGVFGFPWQEETLSRWAMITLGLVISGELATAGLLVSGVAGGGMNLIAGFSLAFFGMVVFWTSLWTYSYMAGCTLAVMQDTSSGSWEVLSWPEGDWREWMWPMLHVGYVLAVAVTIGYVAGWVAGLVLDFGGMVWAVTSFVLFPVFLVSSMEANSALVILTRPVLASLFSLWWGWLTVLLLAAALVCGVALVMWIASLVSWFAVPLAAGPAMAAAVLIYARLLGRLAWRAD